MGSHDQGPQFTAEHFQVMCSQLGIVSKATPTQSHNSLYFCERYDSLIKRVYTKLQNDDPDQDKHQRLALSVHAVNSTAGPEGLTSSIHVSGAVPRIPLPDCSSLPPDEKTRFRAMKIARQEMETIKAQRRVASALKHRHSLRPHSFFKFGDKVRICREEKNEFAVPYTGHTYDNEKTAYVMTDKIRPFSASKISLITLSADENQALVTSSLLHYRKMLTIVNPLIH